MGGGDSRPSTPPPPPPSPLFQQPWRETPWGGMKDELQFLTSFRPGNDEVNHIRVMLYGPVGAGKSSFINSVNNILQGRMASHSLVDSISAGDSFTKKYTTHKIKKSQSGEYCSFLFNDMMGLSRQGGVCEEDVKLALKGRVREGYKFNPASSLSEDDPGFNRSPTPDDKVHVLVCVLPSESAGSLDEDVLKMMRNIRLAASDMGIPQIALITKIDGDCKDVNRDLRNVYKSKYLKKQMEEFNRRMGIPMNCIFPVKNYHEEIDLDGDISVLILRAMRQIIQFGNDFVEKI